MPSFEMVFFAWHFDSSDGSRELAHRLIAPEAFALLYALVEVLGSCRDVTVQRHGNLPGHVVLAVRTHERPGRQPIAVLELANGSLAVCGSTGMQLGARRRPDAVITADPLGFSAGPAYGHFRYGLTHEELIARWGSEAGAAQEVGAALSRQWPKSHETELLGDYG